jgi:hypothetical protein
VEEKEHKIFPIGSIEQVDLAVNKGRKIQDPKFTRHIFGFIVQDRG